MKTHRSIQGSTVTTALSVLIAASLFLTATSRATVMVSNLANSLDGYDHVDYTTSSGAGQTLANDFTTGSTIVSLDDIKVNFFGGYDASGTGFKAALYSDQGPAAPAGGAGSFLADLIGSDPHGGGIFAFTPTSAILLAANTRYWAVFSALNSSPDKDFPISFTNNTSQTGASGWSIGDHYAALQVTNGVPNTGVWNYAATGTALNFAVDASAAPEPSKVLLLLGGLGGLIIRRRRVHI